jgi:hypothetical protein
MLPSLAHPVLKDLRARKAFKVTKAFKDQSVRHQRFLAQQDRKVYKDL